ncbi:MAG: hypothetical protein C5B59_08745 [Bacteroidetes bacterium]|nr:MAG: hypothetical protein C5B59_08745 [Bacteroidota bacterium]
MGFPQVPKQEAINFSKVWKNPAGLTIILDDTAIQFAMDFANVVLKSFIVGQIQAAAAKKAAEEKQKGAGSSVTPTNAISSQTVPAPKPSGIVLTD